MASLGSKFLKSNPILLLRKLLYNIYISLTTRQLDLSNEGIEIGEKMNNFSKMFVKDWLDDRRPTSNFAVDRVSYLHSGLDFGGYYGEDLKDYLSGVVDTVEEVPRTWGKRVTVKSNPRFSGGVNDSLYLDYCHCKEVVVEVNQFVAAGDVIATMGNTGNCWYWDSVNNRWDKVDTEEERVSGKGTHLHFGIWQKHSSGRRLKPGEQTKLFKELKKLKFIRKESEGTDFIYQWGKIYYTPNLIFRYFEFLNEKYSLLK
jgi:hypothetical protein